MIKIIVLCYDHFLKSTDARRITQAAILLPVIRIFGILFSNGFSSEN